MPSVALMLRSESAAFLPQPKLPGFGLGLHPAIIKFSSPGQDESFTVNEVTITMLEAREKKTMGRWGVRAATTLRQSHILFCSSFLLFTLRPLLSTASDTLFLNESLSINQTLVSAGQKFELGFFSTVNQKKWYVGIWYKELPTRTIVWVANKDAPVWSSSATLKLGDQANIVILDQGSSIRWSSNQSQATNPVIRLLNTGNLVVCEMFDESPERYIWQSFDHPTDTLLPGQKLGWNLKTGLDRSMSIEDCESLCRKDCNCTAYASSDVDDGVWSGCVIWSGDLIDMRSYVQGGQDLYVRLAASDLVEASSSKSGSKNTKKMIISGSIAFGLGVLLFIAGCIIWKRKTLQAKHKRELETKVSRPGAIDRIRDVLLNGATISSKRVEANAKEIELPLFDLDTIAMATDNFSSENELGQGGFGSVYKAMLVEGEEMAVKRLSKNSGQGSEEFKNEVKLIAKLQHRNLVRLLGCCVQRDEKIIIYEYLPNKSLDCFLFNEERSSLLNWQSRFDIICGVVQGLVYLHRDSRFRIIHRDLKASNILLDANMHPKISDFGMARIFGGDETEANNTKTVVGTYGYMSPEYAMHGIFSFKSDVFSFGVLMLEIVSGKKNRRFYNSKDNLNLLGYAWKLWREGKGIELLDTSVGDSYSEQEVLRCIQIGLLCVQASAEDRPTMPSVALMLTSESAAFLPQPKLPGFGLGLHPAIIKFSSSGQDESFTINEVTITMLEDR
ncbi:hypothetical protein Nepgr_028751 [Nepenthes gracilis]|uniref:Receptor-like serine/threonine-protein kinase n=1 Tax=Nepenthes gracilis TaxID=150966 RepID=A0AAD3Y2P1_NEPGR|nr:hypothetical protein Nepgr_028751 [Nepenthes gracilis]